MTFSSLASSKMSNRSVAGSFRETSTSHFKKSINFCFLPSFSVTFPNAAINLMFPFGQFGIASFKLREDLRRFDRSRRVPSVDRPDSTVDKRSAIRTQPLDQRCDFLRFAGAFYTLPGEHNFYCSGSVFHDSVISVSTQPGHTALNRSPSPAYWRAADLVSPVTPCFIAV